MNTHTYQVGDVVAVIHRNRILQRTVKAVRTYKQRTKVTLSDDSEWCASGSEWNGAMWSTTHMQPMTPELQAQRVEQARKDATRWAADNWNALPADVREQIGDIARKAKRARVEPKP